MMRRKEDLAAQLYIQVHIFDQMIQNAIRNVIARDPMNAVPMWGILCIHTKEKHKKR